MLATITPTAKPTDGPATFTNGASTSNHSGPGLLIERPALSDADVHVPSSGWFAVATSCVRSRSRPLSPIATQPRARARTVATTIGTIATTTTAGPSQIGGDRGTGRRRSSRRRVRVAVAAPVRHPAKATMASDTAANSPRPWSHSKRTGHPASGYGCSVPHDVGDDDADHDEDADGRRSRPAGAGRGRRAGRPTPSAATSAQPGPDEQDRRRRPTRRPRSSGGAIGDRSADRANAAPAVTVDGTVCRRSRATGRGSRGSPARSGRGRSSAASGPSSARTPSTGPSHGGIHQPLKPPSTSCGGPRSAGRRRRRPGVVEALAEHEPAAVRAAVDGDVAAGAALRRHRRRSGRRPRSPRPAAGPATGRPARRGRRRARCRRRSSSSAGGSRRRASSVGRRTARPSTGSPARRSAIDALRRAPATGAPSSVTRSSRHPVSSRSGTTVRASADISLIAAG